MKKLLFLMMVFFVGLSAYAVGITEENNDNTVKKHIITDHAGQEVEVPVEIKRVAVTGIYPLPSVLTIFFNSADKIVSMNTPSLTAAKAGLLGVLYPEILNVDVKSVSSGGESINAEELIKLNPDVVFYSTIAESEIIKSAGIPAVALSVNKWDFNPIETLDNWLSLLSQLFPEDAEKATLVHQFSEDAYNLVQQRVSLIPESERARIFFLFQYTPNLMLTSGRHFWGKWWAEAIGAVNVGNEIETQNSVQVGMEQVYDWNPDVILITNFTAVQADDVLSGKVFEDDWSALDAVADGKVFKMPLGMYRTFTAGVDTPVTLLWMAKTVYPDLFSDIDISAYVKDYYKNIFNVELTDEQVNLIFAPPASSASGL